MVLESEIVSRFMEYNRMDRIDRELFLERFRVGKRGQEQHNSDSASFRDPRRRRCDPELSSSPVRDRRSRALRAVLRRRRVDPADHVVADVVDIETGVVRLLLNLDSVENPDPLESRIPLQQRLLDRIR